MKTSKKDFEQFKKEFMRWVEIFGLKDWEIFFKLEPVEGGFAQCSSSLTGRITRISLSPEYEAGERFDPVKSGKHEAIELLLAPLYNNAICRFVSEEELKEASHTIVRILEKVLK
jgi:hypothetical protein